MAQAVSRRPLITKALFRS